MTAGAWVAKWWVKIWPSGGLNRNLFLKNTQTRENIEQNGRDDWIRPSDPLTTSLVQTVVRRGHSLSFLQNPEGFILQVLIGFQSVRHHWFQCV